MPHQSVDQAAHRRGYSTEDHLLTVTLLIERSREFNFPIWLALVDFTKAFDTVEHAPLWEVLKTQSVPAHYVQLLEELYSNQVATVQTSRRSRCFSVCRGVKQGDPVSALLFIAVMQACFGELQGKWGKANAQRKGKQFGICLDATVRNLTDLRFADDVILVSQLRSDIGKMLRDLSAASAKFGLEINFQKTKVMTWSSLAGGHDSVDVFGQSVAILDEEDAERYLGRKLSFGGCHETEISNRIAAGWAAFSQHKSELCCSHYSLSDRIKLFEAAVTPAVLYACSTWTLTGKLESKLQVARRKMLRYVFRLHRRSANSDPEDWVHYLRRVASTVAEISEQHGMIEWVAEHRRRKWRFAGKLSRVTDGRWSSLILNWKPHEGHGRCAGRPCTRWTDQLEAFAGGDWMTMAADLETWQSAEDVFASWDFSKKVRNQS